MAPIRDPIALNPAPGTGRQFAALKAGLLTPEMLLAHDGKLGDQAKDDAATSEGSDHRHGHGLPTLSAGAPTSPTAASVPVASPRGLRVAPPTPTPWQPSAPVTSRTIDLGESERNIFHC